MNASCSKCLLHMTQHYLGLLWLFLWPKECTTYNCLLGNLTDPPLHPPHLLPPTCPMYATLVMLQSLFKTISKGKLYYFYIYNGAYYPTPFLWKILCGYYQAYVRRKTIVRWIFQICISWNTKCDHSLRQNPQKMAMYIIAGSFIQAITFIDIYISNW